MKSFSIYFLLSVICAYPSAATEAALGEGEEVFLVALRSGLLSELMQKPILQSEPIAETAGRTTMRGSAVVQGTVTAAPLTSAEGLAFQLIFRSTTNIGTTNTTDGQKDPGTPGKSHPEIGARFNTNIVTNAITTKAVLFREAGIAVYGAETHANSLMNYYGNQRVQAQGLLPGRRFESSGGRAYRVDPGSSQALAIPGQAIFPRLRANLAPAQVTNEVLNQRMKAEQDASRSVGEKLTKQFDQTVWDTLLPFHLKYYTYVYRPFVERGLLGGRLGTGSDGNWMAIRGTRGGQLYGVDASAIPGLGASSAEPILLRMHPEFIERIAEMRLGGTAMTEVEAAEMMGYTPPDEETAQNVIGDGAKEVLFVFDEKKPIGIRFIDEQIELSLRLSEAATLGETLKNIKVTRLITITKGNGGSLTLKMLPPQRATYYDGTPIGGTLGAHITHRFGRLLKKEPIELSKKVFFSDVKPMTLSSLNTEANRLTLGLAPAADAGVVK